MAVTPLTVEQRDQFALHINDIRRITVVVDEEKPPSWSGCDTANEGFGQFEQRAGGFPRSAIDVCNAAGGGATLHTSEIAASAGQVNALTAVVEGGDGVAADVANEILALLEERLLGIPETGRDVTQTQLP